MEKIAFLLSLNCKTFNGRAISISIRVSISCTRAGRIEGGACLWLRLARLVEKGLRWPASVAVVAQLDTLPRDEEEFLHLQRNTYLGRNE